METYMLVLFFSSVRSSLLPNRFWTLNCARVCFQLCCKNKVPKFKGGFRYGFRRHGGYTQLRMLGCKLRLVVCQHPCSLEWQIGCPLPGSTFVFEGTSFFLLILDFRLVKYEAESENMCFIYFGVAWAWAKARLKLAVLGKWTGVCQTPLRGTTPRSSLPAQGHHFAAADAGLWLPGREGHGSCEFRDWARRNFSK